MMNSSLVDDILTLLAVTLIADKKVLGCEVEAFIEMATTIETELGFEKNLSQTKLFAWFYRHEDRLKHLMAAKDFPEQITAIFDRLSTLPDKYPILERMHFIACSDDQFHISEKALMVLASRHWGVEVETLSDLA